MRWETEFVVRYVVDDPVPIADIIQSLQSVETLLLETAAFLPSLYPGLQVEQTEIRVRSVVQESPLREAFLAALLVAYQQDLSREVPHAIESVTGHAVPANLHTTITVVALILAFYGVDAVKKVLLGPSEDGPAKKKLDELVKEVAQTTGLSEKQIHEKLEDRYAQKTAWSRLTQAAGRFFKPSKRQNSAPLEVNNRYISESVVRDVPQDFILDHAAEAGLFRTFTDVPLELHAQDRDHSGQGWAANIPGVTPKRLKLRLMPGIQSGDLWGRDQARGDVTVIYQRAGPTYIPKSINLDRLID